MSKSNKPKELELLASCSRIYSDSADIARTRTLLQEEWNWDSVIETAIRHGVMPLLFRNLRRYHHRIVPEAALNHLQQHFLTNATQISLLARELIAIIKLFDSHGIAAIPFKGPLLALQVYNDITLRQFGDLDILIKKSDLEKARRLLMTRGYVPIMLPLRNTVKVQFLINHTSKTGIDLHWQIAPLVIRAKSEQEAFWSRAESITFNHTPMPTLSMEDLLLFLCIHGCKVGHMWEKLIWVCDIAELSRTHSNIDWDHLLQRAEKLDVERMLLLGLALAHQLLGMALPEIIAQRIRHDNVVTQFVEETRASIVQGTQAPGESRQTAKKSKYPYHPSMRKQIRDRIPLYLYRLKFLLIPNELDRSFIALPRALSFLYYLIRPIRLGVVYGLGYRHRFPQP